MVKSRGTKKDSRPLTFNLSLRRLIASIPFTVQGGDIRGEKQKSPAFRENRGSKIYPTASPRKL
jgi:hypothetical protein